MRPFPVVIASVSAAALVLSGCGGSDDSAPESDGDSILVATTVSPITSIVSRVGGDCVDVRGIVPEGTNSHTFEPAPAVAALLSDADVVFINGLKLEDPTLAMAEANMADGAELVELGTVALPEEDYIFDFSFPEEDGKPNPHLWTDPTYAIVYADIVREVLSERDPECADQMQENLEKFQENLQGMCLADQSNQCLDARDGFFSPPNNWA